MIRDRLINWGRYWRDTGKFGHCESIEHRYVPGIAEVALLYAEEQQERRASRPAKPDMHDAVVVNEAYKKCSPRARKVLKWSFCMGRRSDKTVCQMCGIREDPPSVLETAFYNAVKEIERILAEPARSAYMLTPDNLRTSSDKSPPVHSATPVAPSADESTPLEVETID